ncbi:MAG: hypothetical protein IJ342_06955 [Muribaculaceae bacterium]|nr:hypothetical protein [Muribaculaceae bacterium]
MKRINYKSDFDFIAKLTAKNANGESVEVGYPDYDFELIITSGATAIPLRSFVASVIGGVVKNCYNDNGLLHVVCNNHNLNVGQLAIEFKSYIPNRIYPDGIQTIVTTQAMDIELVSTDSNTDTVETELQLPIHVMGEGGSPDLSKYLTKAYAEEVYAKTEDIPTEVSELKNDAGYITKDDIPSVELPDNLVTMDELTKYQPKGDYALRSELPTIPTKVSELENDAEYVDAETLQEKIDAIGGGTSEKEILMMKAYLFDFNGTYTQAQIESSFRVTFDELIQAIKNGHAVVITSSSDTNGNYNIVFGATYTLTDDGKTLNTLSMMWWQYGQWVTLTLTYNASSANYSATVAKTA